MSYTLILGMLLVAACNTCGHGKSGDWEYQYQVEKPGTRSEYIIGKLLFKGKELPEKFEHVITPIGEFTFVKQLAWANAAPGWVPSTEGKNGVQPHFRESDVKELLSGKGTNFRTTSKLDQASSGIDKRPANAASDWFYAIKLRLWINPQDVSKSP